VSFAIAILGLLLLIFIHELGHFGAAKLVGMRALNFTIGFPPILVGKRWGDTEYRIGLIPLGGYVKIPGMLRPEGDDLYAIDDVLERPDALDPAEGLELSDAVEEFRSRINRNRHDEAAESLERVRAAVQVCDHSLTPADRRRIQRNLSRVEEALDPRSYWRSSRTNRLIVILAGPFMNVVACFVILVGLFITGVPAATKTVASVVSPSPAASAGLKPGDTIVSVNGRHLTPDQAHNVILASNGGIVRLAVERHGREIQLPPTHTKKIDGDYRLGFSFGVAPVRHSVFTAPGMATSQMWALTTGTLGALGRVVTPQGRAQLHSVVGITRYSADAVDTGYADYLSILAFISLSLAIFNLLPFLPLDGGHVLMIALEKLRGRAVSRAVFERISAVGIALMLVAFAIGLQNDLGSLITTGPH
jgi:regulator of sigma E protease